MFNAHHSSFIIHHSSFLAGGLPLMSDQSGLPSANLAALLTEKRSFPPSEEFRRQANASDPAIYDQAHADSEGFWAKEAEHLDWFKPWTKVLDWNVPWAKWFVNGKLNLTHNCVDRHAASSRRNK